MPEKRKRGRPALTPTKEQHEAIRRGRAAGMTWEKCAHLAGIAVRTLLSWRDKGADGEEPYAQFLADVEKAEAQAIEDRLGIIKAAAIDSWQAAAWWLERRYPQTYGRKVQELHGKDGKPLSATVVWQTPIGGGTPDAPDPERSDGDDDRG